MSEHQIERRAAEEAAQAEDTYRLRVTDAVLSDLVGACDDSDFSLAVTVQTGGFLVSGVLVSMAAYFHGLAGLVRGASASDAVPETLDVVAGLFEGLGRQQEARRERRLRLLQNPRAPTEPEDNVRPAYLHLRDARLVGPVREIGAIPFWRGRLDHIDAFWLGSLSWRAAGE